MISYAKLWETMKNRGITQYTLIHKYKVSAGQLTRFRENQHVSTHTLEMFCEILDCKIEDIVEYIPDKKSDH